MSDDRIRVLVAKPGLEGHDRGVVALANALKEGGMEVVYLGVHQTPESVVRSAVQEDVSAVALAVSSGTCMTFVPAIGDGLKSSGMDVLVTAVGALPEKDRRDLESLGMGRVFEPGAPPRAVADYIRVWCAEKQVREESLLRKARPKK